jgi:hypothetical protein
MNWTTFPAAEFGAHAANWQKLNEEGAAASPLLDIEFVQPLLTEFGTGKELLAVCTDRDGIVAMAIMTPRRAGAWETFQPSQAPIGMWINRNGADVPALLAPLMRKLPGFPMVVALTQRDPALHVRPSDGPALQTIDYVDTARITVGGLFEDYWNARGKNLRANLKKQRVKLQKEGIEARMETRRQPEEMAQAVADYGRLESAGWKAGQGTAIQFDNAQGRFYRTMLEGFCRRGAASVLHYRFDDKIVAMNLCIEGYGVLIVLKTTYDETLSSHYSPAFLMREETCRQLFEERKYVALEFYGKVMEWHLKWTNEVRKLYHINRYRWPALLKLHTMAKRRTANAVLHSSQPVRLGSSQGATTSAE